MEGNVVAAVNVLCELETGRTAVDYMMPHDDTVTNIWHLQGTGELLIILQTCFPDELLHPDRLTLN